MNKLIITLIFGFLESTFLLKIVWLETSQPEFRNPCYRNARLAASHVRTQSRSSRHNAVPHGRDIRPLAILAMRKFAALLDHSNQMRRKTIQIAMDCSRQSYGRRASESPVRRGRYSLSARLGQPRHDRRRQCSGASSVRPSGIGGGHLCG